MEGAPGGAAGALEPASYARWFETALGRRVWEDERRALDRLVGPVSGRRVLDVGAGDGRLTTELAREGARAVGVDMARDMLRAADRRGRASAVPVDWVAGDAASLPFADGTFDIVVAVTVLCFVREPAAAAREMARVVRGGGLVVLGELGRWSPWALRRRLRGWRGDETWRTARFRSRRELVALLEQAGLRPVATAAAVFYPPSVRLARILRPIDAWLGRRVSLGAAFVAVAGTRAGEPGGTGAPHGPGPPRGRGSGACDA